MKKNLSVLLVVLLALLLIALVVWRYEKRMQELSKRMHPSITLVTKLTTCHHL